MNGLTKLPYWYCSSVWAAAPAGAASRSTNAAAARREAMRTRSIGANDTLADATVAGGTMRHRSPEMLDGRPADKADEAAGGPVAGAAPERPSREEDGHETC